MSPAIERRLWNAIRGIGQDGPTPREIIEELVSGGTIRHRKQAWRTLEKWSRQGKYDYGVTLDLGWKL